ncbi:FG-GAP-like repeat-containing protein [Arachidicoccus soli]|nr:FG-GAP-like repeat-containing protein [Arachidicoccus soli]
MNKFYRFFIAVKNRYNIFFFVCFLVPNLLFSQATIDLSKPVGTPKGGGGENGTGGVSYSIPIEVLPGVNGLQPGISLNYSSQGGDGIAGWGWSLSAYSAISRAGKSNYYNSKAAPVSYTNTNDAFVLNGQRLFPISGDNGNDGTVYGTENESFAKIESFGGTETSGPEWFKVTLKDGTQMEYGNASNSKMWTDDNQSTMIWLLNKITDKNGNYIDYKYNIQSQDRYFNLMEIDYTGNTVTATAPYNKILFSYFSDPDWQKHKVFQGGASLVSPWNLDQISVENSTGSIVESYKCAYHSLHNQEFLQSVTEIGADGTSLNPLKFTYGSDTSASDVDISPSYGQFNYNNTFTGDITGDGKDDVIGGYYSIDNNGVPHYKSYAVFDDFSTYNGGAAIGIAYSYYFPDTTDPTKSGQLSYQRHIEPYGKTNSFSTEDFNGDSKADVLLSNWTISGATMAFNNITINYSKYYGAIVGNTYQSQVYSDIPHSTGYSNAFKYAYTTYSSSTGTYFGTNFISGDFDGDGTQDYILILGINPSNSFKAFYSCPKKGIFNQEISGFGVEGTSTDPFYATSVASASDVIPIDFDGDGKTEILVEKANQSYILSLNFAGTGGLISSTILYTTTDIKSGYRVFPGDFNGDGKADLLVRSSKDDPTASWNILYSTGKAFKSYPFIWHYRVYLDGDNGVSNAHLLMVGDLNGDGRSDIWHSLDNASGGLHSIHCINYSEGIPPDGQNSLAAFTEEEYNKSETVNKSASTGTISGDINGDGKPDVMSLLGTTSKIIFPKPFKEDHLMTSSTDGFGNTTTYDYDLMNRSSNYQRSYIYEYDDPGTSPTLGQNGVIYNVLKSPMYLLTDVNEPNGIGGSNTVAYNYRDAVYSPKRGFLGFKELDTYDYASGISNHNIAEIDASLLLPHTVRQLTLYSIDTLSDTKISDTLLKVSSNYLDKRYVHQILKTLSIDNLTGSATENSNVYDNYGNITSNTTKNGYMSGVSIIPVETDTSTTVYGIHGTPVPAAPELVTISNTRSGQSAANKQMAYTYDAKGNVLTSTDWNGTALATTTTKTYDNFGNVKTIAVNAPNTLTPTVVNTYDNTGRFLTKKQAVGSGITKTETYTYEPEWGLPATSTSSDGLTTSYTYDNSFGRLIKTILPDGNEITKALNWETSGNARYSTTMQRAEDGGMYSKQYYDVLNREIKKENGGFNNQLLTQINNYDYKGNLSSQTEPYYANETLITTINTYDNYGRLTGSSNGASSVTIGYSKLPGGQYKVTTTNGAGQSTSKTQDAAGKVVTSNDNGGQINFTYDSWGNQKSVIIGSNTVVSSVYDAYGRQTSMTDKNAGTIAYEYNALGKVTKQTDALGHVYTVAYDAFGRMTTHSGPEGSIVYTYYNNTSSGNCNDNITQITGFSGDVTNYLYDNLFRPTSESVVFDGTTFTKTMAYDSYGNLIKTTYPSGVIINDTYNKNGILTKTTMGSGAEKTLFTATAMNSRGIYTGYSYGNGKSSTVTYDLVKSAPSRYYTPGIQDLNFNFDAQTGNLLSRKDSIKNLTETFTYDNLNRLTGASVNNVAQFSMSYDNTGGTSLGNIATRSDVGNYVYDNNKINAVKYITSTTGGQTPPGVISQNQQDISYTPFLKADTISQNGYKLSYTYGQDYQRIKSLLKQGSTVVETKYYLGAFERQIKGGITRDIHYINAGNGLCAIIVKEGSAITPYFVYSDHLGSILKVTDTLGDIVAQQNFDAWGRNRNPDNWTYTGIPSVPDWLYRGYTGHEHLAQFALINMNGRMYDPVTGRMLSPDNYIQQPWNSQSYNRYGYCINNPLIYTDPSGEIFGIDDLIFGTVGALINFGTQLISGNVHNFGQALGYIGTGFVSGVAFEYGGPIAAGAIAGAGNAWVAGGSISQIAAGAIIGGVSGGVGQAVGSYAGSVLANATGITGGAIGIGTQALVGGAAAGFTGGALGGMVNGEGLGQSLNEGLNSALVGAALGGGLGAVNGGLSSWANDEHVLTGKPLTFGSTSIGELKGNFLSEANEINDYQKLLGWLEKNGYLSSTRAGDLQAFLDPSENDIDLIFKNITTNGDYGSDATLIQTGENLFKLKLGKYGSQVFFRNTFSNGNIPTIYITVKDALSSQMFKIRFGNPTR